MHASVFFSFLFFQVIVAMKMLHTRNKKSNKIYNKAVAAIDAHILSMHLRIQIVDVNGIRKEQQLAEEPRCMVFLGRCVCACLRFSP